MRKENDTGRLVNLSASQLDDMLRNEDVLLIDVREPVEHASQRIPGSVSMPLSRFDPERLTPQKDQRVVLYCRSGNRSAQAAGKLLRSGWPETRHLAGGIDAWRQQNRAIEGDGKPPMSLERQVRIAAGSLVVIGTALAATLSPWWLVVPGFVGAGLVFAGVTDTCGMAMMLARLPYNQRSGKSARA